MATRLREGRAETGAPSRRKLVRKTHELKSQSRGGNAFHLSCGTTCRGSATAVGAPRTGRDRSARRPPRGSLLLAAEEGKPRSHCVSRGRKCVYGRDSAAHRETAGRAIPGDVAADSANGHDGSIPPAWLPIFFRDGTGQAVPDPLPQTGYSRFAG